MCKSTCNETDCNEWPPTKPCSRLCVKVESRGWLIELNPKPIPTREYDYDFCHDNYDGDNNLCGTASSREDAISKIEDIERENM